MININDFFTKITPIILIFILGVFLRKIRIFGKENAELLLKLVFYVTLPALTFISVSKIQLTPNLFFLPLIAVAVVFIVYGISFMIGKKMNLLPPTLGTFLVGSMIMNTGFSYPFLEAAYGKTGLATSLIFDLGNSFLIFTFIYFIAVKYGSNSGKKIQLKKFLLLPPIWGLVFGITFNLLKIPLPMFVNNFLNQIGMPTALLIMLSLGIYFSPKICNIRKICLVIFLRMGIGLILGILFTLILKLDGLNAVIVIICSAAPVGYNTLVFSSMEKLDKDFAASLVSFSILIGIFWLPALILLLSFFFTIK
ncbi:MAG: AEC family transporter [Candidatus Cloacimonetes bacterium]|jgi:malate permease and related proteins|nr:AEC family transporter [Candidatus Cloacimonadota bacterium]